MLTYLQAILAAIRALYELFRFFQNWKIQQEKVAAEKRQQELEQAVENSKKAESEDEIWKSQDDVISSKPRG